MKLPEKNVKKSWKVMETIFHVLIVTHFSHIWNNLM